MATMAEPLFLVKELKAKQNKRREKIRERGGGGEGGRERERERGRERLRSPHVRCGLIVITKSNTISNKVKCIFLFTIINTIIIIYSYLSPSRDARVFRP